MDTWKTLHIEAQKAEARGDFDHLIHTEEIVEWIAQGRQIADLAVMHDRRSWVQQVNTGGQSSVVWAVIDEIHEKGARIYKNDEGRIVVSPPGLLDEDLRERMRQCRPQLEALFAKSLIEVVDETFGDLITNDLYPTESHTNDAQGRLEFE